MSEAHLNSYKIPIIAIVSFRSAFSNQPHDSTKEINDNARKAAASLIEEGKQNPRRKTFIYINDRLEGNALAIIAVMLDTSSSI